MSELHLLLKNDNFADHFSQLKQAVICGQTGFWKVSPERMEAAETVVLWSEFEQDGTWVRYEAPITGCKRVQWKTSSLVIMFDASQGDYQVRPKPDVKFERSGITLM